MIINTCYGFGVIFIACEVGQSITNSFDEVSDVFGQLNWYKFPSEIRWMLPVILVMVQKSVSFICFGSTLCNRDALNKVNFQ